jgi:LacI family transcriptional regulator
MASPTIRDVAREAGVAVSTASYAFSGKAVLREETRIRVHEAALRLGFRPRPRRSRGAPRSCIPAIGLLLPGGPGASPQDYHYVGETLRGVTEAAHDYGFLVTVLYEHAKNPLFAYGELCRSRAVSGIIVPAPKVRDLTIEGLIADGFPAVLIRGRPSVPGVMPTVGIDDEMGAFRATEHLIILGHKRIAMILPGPTTIQFSADRFSGYRRALEMYCLPFDQALVADGKLLETAAEEAMGRLLESPDPPTAVFAGNDTQAIGAMAAARRRGICVPAGLAVVGFDDTEAARLTTPPLTTMHVSEYSNCREATRMLIRKILKPAIEPQSILLPVELVIRESCGARSEPRHMQPASGAQQHLRPAHVLSGGPAGGIVPQERS